MAFGFQAEFIDADEVQRRLSFADRNDESAKHYFVIDRSEDSPDQPVPDMDNVYIERDDQGFGGFGGIERVELTRESLTLHLGERMATRMGGHAVIQIGFQALDDEFRKLRRVLGLVLRGYESLLVAEGDSPGNLTG